MAQRYGVFVALPLKKEGLVTYAVHPCRDMQRSLLTTAFKQSKTGNVCCLE